EGDAAHSVHLERVVPIYRNISGIPQRRLRESMYEVLQRPELSAFEWDAPLEGGGSKQDAYRRAHFPEPEEAPRDALRRFAFDEFFRIQMNVLWRKSRHERRAGRVLGRKTELLTRFYQSLPFGFTEAQKRAVREILADMRAPSPMNRLLQGDVGSGKTFVAMSAMLLAVDSGVQTALMAPTQILAEQHFLTFRRWLAPLGVRIALRTGNREDASHLEIEGAPQMIIGTHALLYSGGDFLDLGLIVIDEQHKFGVSQRAMLIDRGTVPDVLVMTATPIPRTLTMILYGDLDVSLLDEKPEGRGSVVTGVRSNPKQTDVTAFVREQLDAGRQAYLVYPLVEESDSLKVESATEAFEKWRKRLPGFAVGLIHGKLRPEEKEEVMRRFRDHQIHALVATTVIEVGVDVPNASVMLLHHAERFGLAQLHQLRGRIGRGGHKGYCVLLTDGKNPEALEKLAVLEASSDGFEVAEADLRMRGPGDVLGTRQSGLGGLKFGDFLGDTSLLVDARKLAESVLAADPELSGRHQRLKALIVSEPAATEVFRD
ncbi:MAG: ATP-dependent DNA helicase RecG, partial [Verrucomicrobiae bacterium]|nr:ATP-dependent DNA helicase RecG [Verrucomicrobiae bacterium]